MYDTHTQRAQRPAGQRPAKRREKSGCVCGPQARHRLIRARPAPAAHLQQQHTPLLPSTAAAASVILYPIPLENDAQHARNLEQHFAGLRAAGKQKEAECSIDWAGWLPATAQSILLYIAYIRRTCYNNQKKRKAIGQCRL